MVSDNSPIMRRAVGSSSSPQLQAEIFFQLLDAVAKRGLRQVQVRGSARKAAAFGDAEKRLQSREIDAHESDHARQLAARGSRHSSAKQGCGRSLQHCGTLLYSSKIGRMVNAR
jgi:hypothetical protein